MADDESSLAKKPRIDSEGNGTTIVSSSTQDTLVRDDGEKLNDLLGEADKALQESNRRHIKPVVDENKLGIQLFVGDVKDQYHGLIKARYADFIVHEIDLEGNMAKLDNLEAPVDDNELSSNAMKLEDLFDRKVLVHLSNVNNGTLDTYKIDVTGMDKDMRTSIHNAIKASYDKLDSSTVSDSDQTNRLSRNAKNGVKDNSQDTKEPDSTSHRADGDPNPSKALNNDEEQPAESAGAPAKQGGDEEEKKYILVARRNKASRPRSIWPQDRPDFTHFVLYKENKDTMDAIHNLALATHSKPAHFTYAGTKDRRAVTSQWVSSWRLDPKRLISSMRRFNKRPFIKVGNFCYKKNAIGLGQLRANKFDIVIRHLVHNKRGEKVIEDAMNYVKENGFVNYFGLQRFGTRSVLTHEVGLAILQGKWSQAVDLILSYRYDDTTQPLPNAPDANSNPTTPSGQPESTIEQSNKPPQQQQRNQNQNQKRWASGAEQHNASIDLWKSKQDADLVFKKYPHFRMTNEGLIIRALSRSEESRHDHAAAIVSLPRNTRSMYVHSYQSLLWNKLATLRLKNHGFKVTPGDLILSPEASISDNSLDNMLAVDGADTPEDGSLITGEQPDRAQEIGKTGERKLPVEEIDASIVIASEENLHKYSIFDVVMPLVGSKTKIPANESGKELERLLAEDGLTLESFRARERMFVSYGSYRKIMVKPANLEWSIKQYSHPYENLVKTDLDKLNAADEKVPSDSRPSAPVKSDSSDEALIVSFELPPSSYATMCLRELMKKPSTDFDNRF